MLKTVLSPISRPPHQFTNRSVRTGIEWGLLAAPTRTRMASLAPVNTNARYVPMLPTRHRNAQRRRQHDYLLGSLQLHNSLLTLYWHRYRFFLNPVYPKSTPLAL